MPDAFVARQPIFNPKLEVVGYELLFRGEGYVNDVAMIANPESATATVVLNALTELDLGRIVGRKTAWVNVSREFVTGGLAHALPSDLVGLEIPETAQFDEEMLGALGELKAAGYKLALDDFRYRPGSESLLELFDLVKLNINELGTKQLTDLVERLKPYEGKLVAEKLGTQEQHEFCVEAGCDLFQGYFFCRPAVACTRGIAANRLALLQVAAVLNDPDVELEQIEQLIAHDVALSFRLLRYVNSAFFGLRGDVRSIGQALALLGLDNVKRWSTLSVLASIDDKPTELTVTALTRARFCELAGEPLGIASPAELFTLGLFSVLDAMMDAPMIDVISSLPLAAEMREALVGRKGKRGLLLECVTALETGEISDMPSIVANAGELYLDALMWSNSAAESLFDSTAPGKQAKSTPPPVSQPAPAPVVAIITPSPEPAPAAPGGTSDERGWLARALARCFGWIGRRRLGQESA
ncbi:MAG TPA: HDOD domain-containing protein [Solirubrobacteraceae bacterium]|jgi:EAL and modified HD-GYP domain-containing signal transduction protein